MLESLSHKSVLARGFAMVHRLDGTLVRAAKDLSSGDEVELTFADDTQRAIIDPPKGADSGRPRAKAKPSGGQGSLF
jgi:exodeoxyribonuclease VII large subunit